MSTAKKTAAKISVKLTGAQRINILHEINSRTLTFESSGDLLPVWRTVLGDWAWKDLARNMRSHYMLAESSDPETSAKARDEIEKHRVIVDAHSETTEALRFSRKTLESLRDFLKEKLDQNAPEDPAKQPDTRWAGLIALVMRELYDAVEVALE